MNFQELIRVRRSVRGYKPDAIDDDILYRVLSAARVAPTAANLQPVHLIVITEPAMRERLRTVYARDWFHAAPVIVVGCTDPSKAWQRGDGFNAAEIDAAIVMDHLILAATEEGLATCWVCAFDETKAKEVLGLPPDIRVVAMTPLGYADAEPRPFARKPIEQIVHRERW
jgi:nitroreductase